MVSRKLVRTACRWMAIWLLAVVAVGCGGEGLGERPDTTIREVTLLYTNDFESAYDVGRPNKLDPR